MALSISMYGRPDCEDTALARERLNALGIPFTETNIDVDAGAAAIAERFNAGRRTSPTIVFGGGAIVVSEPGIQTLDKALKRAGHPVDVAPMLQFGPPVSDRSAPWFRLVAAGGREIGLEDFQPRKFLIVAVAAAPPETDALAALRAIDAMHEALTARHPADAVAIVRGEAGAVEALPARVGSRLPLLIDAAGGVADQYAALHARISLPAVFVLDRYGAPRAAGPLTPLQATEAVAWIEYLECECDE